MKNTIKLNIIFAIIAIFTVNTAFSKNLPWPKTFSGQPDFDFNRDDLIKELKEKGDIISNKKATQATMKRLLQTTIINPFSHQVTETAITSKQNKINKDALAELFGDIPENIKTGNQSKNNATLPGYNKNKSIDLTEFADFLNNIIKQRVKLNKERMKGRDFSNDLNKITIQSIVTSPIKYTIINNNRFRIGDRFLIPIQSKIFYSEIDALLAPYIPQPESFSEDVYKKYVDIKNKTIEKYKSENTKGTANVIVHNISVTIRDILHRKVIVSVYGHEYELKIKHAF